MGRSTQNRPFLNSRELAIVLHPRFAMSDMMGIVDWLQAANSVVKAERFRWSIYSQQGLPVIADNGMVLTALLDTKQLERADQLLLLAGRTAEFERHNESDLYVGIPRCMSVIPTAILMPDGYLLDDFLPDQDASNLNIDDLMAALLFSELTPEQGEQLLEQRNGSGDQVRINDGRIHRALQLMRDNLEIPLDSRELASRTYLSVRQLERLFRRYFDETPARYYTRIRLQSARRMLRSDEASVTDVALACGFGSVPHFCKLYRKRYGVTPGQDR